MAKTNTANDPQAANMRDKKPWWWFLTNGSISVPSFTMATLLAPRDVVHRGPRSPCWSFYPASQIIRIQTIDPSVWDGKAFSFSNEGEKKTKQNLKALNSRYLTAKRNSFASQCKTVLVKGPRNLDEVLGPSAFKGTDSGRTCMKCTVKPLIIWRISCMSRPRISVQRRWCVS